MVSMPSVMPTVAVESAPKCATKKVSTMANRASIAISSTIGTASRKIAWSTEMAVKSRLEPKIASLTRSNHRSGSGSGDKISVGSVTVGTGELKAVSPFQKRLALDEVRRKQRLPSEQHAGYMEKRIGHDS